MKIVIPVCIICEATDVQLWTLDNAVDAAVTYVCTEHSAPLMAIVEASQGLPLELQMPLSQRKTLGKQTKAEVRLEERERKKRMAPLTDWTPPPGMPAPPRREHLSAEARAALRIEQETAAADRAAARAARAAQAAAIRAEREAEAAAKAARYEAEELLVRNARAEGKTWEQIGAMLGKTRQDVWSRYSQRYRAKGSPEQVAVPLPVDAGVDVPVDLPDDAPEVGAGGHGHDVVFSGGTEVHDPGLQPLQGSDTLDRVKKKRGRPRKRTGGDAVIDQIEVA